MATIDDIKGKLDQLTGIKAGIKEAIISKGQSVGDNMTEYADAIKNISSVKPNYLTFTADAESSVYLQNNGSNSPNCEYSFNGVDWITMPTADADKVTIPAGESIFVRGNNPSGFSSSSSKYSCFVMTGSISASGSVMSLIDGTGEATTIPSNFCFYRMFYNCTALTVAPKLPATTLADSCYRYMFYGCSSLVTAPELPATTLTSFCYAYMFYGCSSLVTAPELPVTTLASYCYWDMFGGCSSLVTAPELPATTLASYCYSRMFYNCTVLTVAPELPVTTLASYCYAYMFCGCSSLVTAPDLPATTLASYCYTGMFSDCTALNYIKCLAVSGINQNNSTSNWMTNAGSKVTGTKTFVQTGGVTWPTGSNGIPSGWIVKYNEVEPAYSSVKVSAGETVSVNPPEGQLLERVSITFKNKPSCLTFTADAESSVYLQNNGSNSPNCEYSFNGTDWITMPTTSADKVAIPAGEKIFVRGNNPSGFSTSDSKYSCFAMTGSISASGSVMSIIDGAGETTTIPCDYCFFHMFYNCTALTVAPKLPATTLASRCYWYMFCGCSSLTTAPELPATTLASYCYWYMFGGCSSLVTAPDLPATTLAPGCYGYMFANCSSLTTAPELLATTLADSCYRYMFNGCSSLVTAPKLPATFLVRWCYGGMFYGCTTLTVAPELPATTLASDCYDGMFYGCSSLVTAPELPATTLASDCYWRMFYGCSSLTTAPDLPATTLATGCYGYMFQNCSALTTAPDLPATTLENGCYGNMFYGCSSLVTAPELPATTLADSCYDGMFRDCSSLNYVRCYFTGWGESSSCTSGWLSGVSSTGNFYGPIGLDMSVRDNSHIPSGWTARYNVVKKVELTQAEYDNLYDNKQLDPDTIYIITT